MSSELSRKKCSRGPLNNRTDSARDTADIRPIITGYIVCGFKNVYGQ